jgi:hypothetical protein
MASATLQKRGGGIFYSWRYTNICVLAYFLGQKRGKSAKVGIK